MCGIVNVFTRDYAGGETSGKGLNLFPVIGESTVKRNVPLLWCFLGISLVFIQTLRHATQLGEFQI